MTTQRSDTRNAIVTAMANASLFEIIQQARKQREEMVANANAGRDSLIATADQQFVRTVINAAIELDGAVIQLDDDDESSDDDDDD